METPTVAHHILTCVSGASQLTEGCVPRSHDCGPFTELLYVSFCSLPKMSLKKEVFYLLLLMKRVPRGTALERTPVRSPCQEKKKATPLLVFYFIVLFFAH